MSQLTKLHDINGRTVLRSMDLGTEVGVVFTDNSYLVLSYSLDRDDFPEARVLQRRSIDTEYELGVIDGEEYERLEALEIEKHRESLRVKDLELLKQLKAKYEAE